jgi:RimJ/RimL family protein N-acetyltransferase
MSSNISKLGTGTGTAGDAEIRPMRHDDGPAILAFAQLLPVSDLLFLRRDIRNEKVVTAWIEMEQRGLFRTFVVAADGRIQGSAAVVRDPLSWSPHVAEIRIVVAPELRGGGIGRRLAEEAFTSALADGAEKLFVQIVPEQRGAIALFEEMGFRAEAMLRDHVRDADGNKHDLAVLSLDVLRQGGQHRAFGLG